MPSTLQDSLLHAMPLRVRHLSNSRCLTLSYRLATCDPNTTLGKLKRVTNQKDHAYRINISTRRMLIGCLALWSAPATLAEVRN